MSSSISSLERKIETANVVSFDVFDTAIFRKIDKPHRLFDLMVPGVAETLGENASEFPARQFHAEQIALGRAEGGEIRLDEIYKAFAQNNSLDAGTVEALCQYEIRSQLAICCQNPFIYSLYRTCIERGKTILFVSDMYLAKEVVAEILKKCGYSQYGALFVSSESRHTKSAGTLYDEISRQLGIPTKRWLHIGDNPISDVRRPRKRGIATWRYVPPEERFKRGGVYSEAWQPARPISSGGYVVKGLLANRFSQRERTSSASARAEGFWEDFGYSAAGPLYVGFGEWLVERVAKYNPQAVYFLARDGFVIQKLFDKFRPAGLANIKSHYIYASRRAMQFAAIQGLDEQALRFLGQSYALNEVGVHLRRIGLDPAQHEAAIRQAGFQDAGQPVRLRKDIVKLRQLFRLLEKSICERAAVERQVMLDYLVGAGISSGRRVALVDVGWQGSLHKSIQAMLEQSGHFPQITGLFVGTVASPAAVALDHSSYLFKLGEPREYRDIVLSCPEIMELLFSSVEGSLIRMERGSGGGFKPVQRAVTAAEASRSKIVESIQESGMQFVADYLALKGDFPGLSLTADDAFNQLRRVLRRPTSEEADRLGSVPDVKDFGDSTPGLIAAQPRLLRLLRRRGEIRRRQGGWTAGIEARTSWLYRVLYRLRMRDLA